MTVTESDILAAIQQAIRSGQGETGYTMRELAEIAHVASDNQHRKLREAVRHLLASGTWETIKVVRPALDGRLSRIAGYRPKT